ncbi:uncharacterized protein LOC110837148 [Zootermopsis nevadensis]|uniref:Uncharacterized protein n=1 Tax=Zootermopsis nevadensis TaxID=136037 RepID=A0A067QYK8_ZOONE|nr:uncharacterized protein LOC110837148 [Zootermopsis nevadensis]KDR11365.1 hypothetical protein L798_14868 [Zootermopsis nevadensis]
MDTAMILFQLMAILATCSSSFYGQLDGYPHEVETIDLGRAQETTHTIQFPLPVRTVRVTKTVAVPIPVPYPIRRDVPVPVLYPKPVPVPVPVQLQQHQAAPVGLVLYDAGRSLAGYDGYPSGTGRTGATIGHHEGSIGVVVGASYGVSGPVGSAGKYPGTVVPESVGVNEYTQTGDLGQTAHRYQNSGSDASSSTAGSADNYSITKSVETTYDGSGPDSRTNNIQGYGEDPKGK